jgi:hypothetical protein
MQNAEQLLQAAFDGIQLRPTYSPAENNTYQFQPADNDYSYAHIRFWSASGNPQGHIYYGHSS